MEYIFQEFSYYIKEIGEAVHYLITTFIIILDEIMKKSGKNITELATFIINIQSIKKGIKFKINIINNNLEAIVPVNIYNSFYI